MIPMKEASTHIKYQFPDFLKDFEAYGRISSPARKEKDQARAVLDYFGGRYPDRADAEWKMWRCCSAAAYWEKNRSRLDFGNLSVVGSKDALVSRVVVYALWVCWTRDSCDPLTYDPPIDSFARACIETADKNRAKSPL